MNEGSKGRCSNWFYTTFLQIEINSSKMFHDASFYPLNSAPGSRVLKVVTVSLVHNFQKIAFNHFGNFSARIFVIVHSWWPRTFAVWPDSFDDTWQPRPGKKGIKWPKWSSGVVHRKSAFSGGTEQKASSRLGHVAWPLGQRHQFNQNYVRKWDQCM